MCVCLTAFLVLGSLISFPVLSSDGSQLATGPVLCSLGARYHGYCSNVSRTLLFGPTQTQTDNYKFLLEVQSAALDALRPGV